MDVCISKDDKTTAYFENALKIDNFCNSGNFQGGTLEKKFFCQFFKITLFHFGKSYGPIFMQCKDIRMLK